MRTCAGCEAKIEPAPRERNKRKWCSESCRVKAHRERTGYEPPPRPAPPARSSPCSYCGAAMPNVRRVQCGDPECQRRYNADRARERKRLLTGFYDAKPHLVGQCDRCGAEFTIPPAVKHKKRFCSDECRRTRPGRARRAAEAKARTAAKGSRGTSVWIAEGDGLTQVSKSDHYQRLSPITRAVRSGDGALVVSALLAEALPNGDCMEWQRQLGADGYPKVNVGGKRAAPHRLMGEALFGPLHGEPIHHICANRRCIAPAHLQRVTQRENVAEMLERNWYITRIAALERALASASPDHPLIAGVAA